MEIGEQMLYLARLKGLSKADAIKRIKFWFEKMEMQTWWKKKVEDLSKGMQQKVQFVATVLHDPELIILDEPFSGFDPVNAEIIKDEILELNKKGTTIIFSTHRMESVEQLCHHIALIHKSHKILDGSIKDIKNAYRNETYKIQYEGSLNLSQPSNFEVIQEAVQDETQEITIKLNLGIKTNDVLLELIPQVQIKHMEEVIPSINEIFIQKVTALN
ncbi:ABC transporter ATP-binding protein [Pedobacter aquae]|uniref:ABC transporter ATP-binding protein n=1 Tax=Pedobacter aquae TaxID=2605747 RepID=UPI0021D0FE4E|nr:ATP-binding cassette domain-containing protein [Pedobacter aquae]